MLSSDSKPTLRLQSARTSPAYSLEKVKASSRIHANEFTGIGGVRRPASALATLQSSKDPGGLGLKLPYSGHRRVVVGGVRGVNNPKRGPVSPGGSNGVDAGASRRPERASRGALGFPAGESDLWRGGTEDETVMLDEEDEDEVEQDKKDDFGRGLMLARPAERKECSQASIKGGRSKGFADEMGGAGKIASNSEEDSSTEGECSWKEKFSSRWGGGGKVKAESVSFSDSEEEGGILSSELEEESVKWVDVSLGN